MSEFIPASDLISVRFAKRRSPDTLRSGITEEFTPARSHIGVTFAVPPSIKLRISKITQKFIPVKSRIGNFSAQRCPVAEAYLCFRVHEMFMFLGAIYARSAFPIVSRWSVIVRSTRSMARQREIRIRITRRTHSRPMRVVSSSSRSSNNNRNRRSKDRSWSWMRLLLSLSAKGKAKLYSTRSTSVRWPSQSLNDSAREYLSGAGKEVNFFNLVFNINLENGKIHGYII